VLAGRESLGLLSQPDGVEEWATQSVHEEHVGRKRLDSARVERCEQRDDQDRPRGSGHRARVGVTETEVASAQACDEEAERTRDRDDREDAQGVVRDVAGVTEVRHPEREDERTPREVRVRERVDDRLEANPQSPQRHDRDERPHAHASPGGARGLEREPPDQDADADAHRVLDTVTPDSSPTDREVRSDEENGDEQRRHPEPSAHQLSLT